MWQVENDDGREGCTEREVGRPVYVYVYVCCQCWRTCLTRTIVGKGGTSGVMQRLSGFHYSWPAGIGLSVTDITAPFPNTSFA